MPSPKWQRRGGGGGGWRMPPRKRLYLVFDDWSWGYSIRELDLYSAAHQLRRSARPSSPLRLPQPFIRLEAPRGMPSYFSAVGSRIVATHARNPFDDDSVAEGFLPIVDVHSRGVVFGPGQVSPFIPLYISIGDDLFALDDSSFDMLSLKPLWPPRLEIQSSCDICQWSWRELPMPPFRRLEVTSYAVHSDGHTILVSTDSATLAFDTAAALVWKRQGEWTMPFTGLAHFVPHLNAFVGLSKDPATLGHLCSCDEPATTTDDRPPTWKLGKEKLFSEDPAESHVGATLVYMDRNEFCLVQCVSIAADQGPLEEGDRQEQQGEVRRCSSYIYRLTTFCLGYDHNGDLTTGDTRRMRRYKVPEEITQAFDDPVAFWL